MKFNQIPKHWLLGLFVVILSTSCIGTPTETPSSVSDRGLEPADSGSSPLSKGVMLSYQRSGGFAGLDETWLVYEDGRIEGPEGQESTVDPVLVTGLLEDMKEAGFFSLDPQYKPENPCCDRFVYVLKARSGDRVQQMTAVDGVESVPAGLWKSLELVQAFIEAHSNQGDPLK